ncbi:MAG: helix-turn-helix transcriptional regulator [Gallionellaceae bacterium]|nr:helix-turn-helix transcriptional regulator [Gallionellaceae bacterium]
MKAQAALTHIRQLCCLGLGSEIIMPALFQSLHDYIPSFQNIFFWVGADGGYTNIYDENLQNHLAVVQLHFTEFSDTPKEKECWPGGLALIRSSLKFVNTAWYLNKQTMRTEYYNEIFRGLNAHYVIFAKTQEQGRCTGILGLFRPITDKPYTHQEERNLRALMPYIAHSLHRPADPPPSFTDTGEQGLVIMDQSAQVRYLCPGAHQLLFWASHAQFSPQYFPTIKANPFPPVLPQLCHNLIAIFQGQAAPAPVLEQQNSWGRFTFRAHWLDPYNHSASSLIGITIRRQEPVALSLARQIQHCSLSPKLKDVCLLLAQGHTQQQIAAQMHLSNHTVTGYVRTLYDKLGVHSREDLLKLLKTQRVSEITRFK